MKRRIAMGRPKLKLDDKGRPRRMPASYIMKKDERARAAFDAMRKRGLSREEAWKEIEVAFENAFRETVFVGIDRRLEIWIALEEGKRAKELFADLDAVLNSKFGENDDLIQRMRRENSQFIRMDTWRR
jgi:hypothetical protein